MYFVPTTIYFLEVNNNEKDLGKESKSTLSIYNFMREDWLRMLLCKPLKDEEVDVNKDESEKKDEAP